MAVIQGQTAARSRQAAELGKGWAMEYGKQPPPGSGTVNFCPIYGSKRVKGTGRAYSPVPEGRFRLFDPSIPPSGGETMAGRDRRPGGHVARRVCLIGFDIPPGPILK